jgi:hypothetical protein
MLALTDVESLVSRFVATRVRRGRRKHWLPSSSPVASIHLAPRGRERAAIKTKRVATLGGQNVAIGITGAR